MTLIMVYLTLLLCLPAVIAKLSLLSRWVAVVYGAVLLGFCLIMTDVASMAPRAQILQYTSASQAREAVAVLVTVELLMVVAYAFREWTKRPSPRPVRRHPVRLFLERLLAPVHLLLSYYVTLLVFPTLFFIQVQLCYALPGISFWVPSGIVGGCSLVFVPLLAEVLRRSLPARELREELVLMLSTLLCICALLSTTTDSILYRPAEHATGMATEVALTLGVIVLLFIVTLFVQKNRTYKLK